MRCLSGKCGGNQASRVLSTRGPYWRALGIKPAQIPSFVRRRCWAESASSLGRRTRNQPRHGCGGIRRCLSVTVGHKHALCMHALERPSPRRVYCIRVLNQPRTLSVGSSRNESYNKPYSVPSSLPPSVRAKVVVYWRTLVVNAPCSVDCPSMSRV